MLQDSSAVPQPLTAGTSGSSFTDPNGSQPAAGSTGSMAEAVAMGEAVAAGEAVAMAEAVTAGEAVSTGGTVPVGLETRLTHTRSHEEFQRAQRVIPGGVNSPARAFGAVGGEPVVIRRGEGPFLWDVDGNRYIDFIGSWGAAYSRAPASGGDACHCRGAAGWHEFRRSNAV